MTRRTCRRRRSRSSPCGARRYRAANARPGCRHRVAPARPLRAGPAAARRSASATGPVKVLVVGSIHGNETAGRAVLARLRKATPPEGVELWLVDSVNPDGVRRGTRQNARGVDLNRNFGRRWAGGGRAFDTYFPGRRAFSEPESRAVRRLVQRIRPAVTVWYHQHMRLVNLSSGADPRVVRAYARRVGLPARPLPNYHGTATSWQNHTFPGTSCVRRRAAGRPAVRRLRAPPCAGGAGRRAAPPPPSQARPRDRLAQDPVRRHPPRPDARVRQAPLRHRDRHAAPEGDRRALHRLVDVLVGVQHVRRQRPRRRAARAAGRVLALHRRQGRDDLPARVAEADLPPHRRPQRPRDRDRARRHVRRRDAGPAEAAPRVARAHALAAVALRDQRRAT